MKFGSLRPFAMLIGASWLALLVASAVAAPGPAAATDGPASGWTAAGAPALAKPSEYRHALKAIKAKRYDKAIGLLLKAKAKSPNDADILYELAVTYRQSGEMDKALDCFNQALAINPDHRPARAHLGELYLKEGKLAQAQRQLAELERICPTGCPERSELEAAIAGSTAAP